MNRDDYASQWLSDVDLTTAFTMLQDNGVTEVLYKVLPRNANSKNQVYLGGTDLSQFGKIPAGEMTAHVSVSEKNGRQEAVFQAPLEFYWIGQNGNPSHAPEAKLIFYPQYPEVRFSGFLKGCKNPPSALWAKDKRGQEPGRILLLGIGNGKKIYAITLPPESPAAKEIRATEPHDVYGAFGILAMPGQKEGDGYLELMSALCSIHHRSWVPSARLDKDGQLVACNAPNCNGNTLESLLGIRSNGFSLPDFRGWEVKARNVANVDKPGASTVTLFTPEPTSGIYADVSVGEFVRRFGYPDTKGRPDRLNFGGVYRAGKLAHHRTGLRLVLDGFDASTKNYTSTGSIQLLDNRDNIAAAWPFTKLMDHWKVKHSHAAFIPSQPRNIPDRQYRFGRAILLGEGADFRLLLNAVHEGKVYYDPGIKLEDAMTTAPKSKKRSQFRVASKNIPDLYSSSRTVDACREIGALE